MKEKQKDVLVRFPDFNLWEKISKMAEAENRSINGQIIHMLKAFFKGKK